MIINKKSIMKEIQKNGHHIFKGSGFPDFYHIEGNVFVTDIIKIKDKKLTRSQERMKSFLEIVGVRYRIWEIDDATKINSLVLAYDNKSETTNAMFGTLLKEKGNKTALGKKLSKLQKMILIYVGVVSTKDNKDYIERKMLTEELYQILYGGYLAQRTTNKSFPSVISSSLNGLIKRELIIKKRRRIVITEKGKEIARSMLNDIKQQYEKANWSTVKKFIYHTN